MNNTAALAVLEAMTADLKNASKGTFVTSVESNLETAECATRGVVKVWLSGGYREIPLEGVPAENVFVDAVERACSYLYGFSSPLYTARINAAEVAAGGVLAQDRRDRR